MSDTNIVKEIFTYFAKFPKQEGVLELFSRTTAPDQEYQDFKDGITNLTEHSLITGIEDFVFGISKKFVQDRIRNLKTKFMFLEYGQATTTENTAGHQKDTRIFLSLSVANKFSDPNNDVAQETIIMSDILDDIIAIETKILADSKADKCYFARLMDFPIERLPIEPREFFDCIGWTLIFYSKLNIH